MTKLFHNLALFCGNTHSLVFDLAAKLFNELKRTYYVTPTIYIELVTNYTNLLASK